MNAPLRPTGYWSKVLHKTTAVVSLTLMLLVGYPTRYAISQENDAPCQTSQEDSWICEGDEAWIDGYLVPKLVFEDTVAKVKQLDRLKGERDDFKTLSEEFQDQRDMYRLQRDEYRNLLDSSKEIREQYRQQRNRFEKELTVVEDKYMKAAEEAHRLEKSLQSSYQPWEVGLIAGSVGVLSVLVGLGVGALAWK